MPAGFVRAGMLTVAVTGVGLALNLATGIVVARVLGPGGRGALAAVLAAPPILSWIFEMGCSAAATYHQARHPDDASRLISTWLVLFVPLAVAGIATGEVLLPHLLAAQSHHTLLLARILMPTIAISFVADLLVGIVLGEQDFVTYNLIRVAQPLGVAIAYAVLWPLGALTVTSAIAATAGTAACVTALLVLRVIGRHGLGRPSRTIARTTFWFGLRSHSTSTAGMVNTRLDVLIIPAFLGASSVGLYSIATNVSWIVVTVAGSLSAIVFPAAARQGLQGRYTVVKSLYATLAIAGLGAGALALVASVGVRIVYGASFSGSVTPLRILLLGSVFYAAAGTVCSGLSALNRPFTAGLAQLSAAVVTVAGLLLFLQRGGIRVAAIVSVVAYGLVFVVALALYRRASGLRWAELVPTPSLMRLWARQAARGALGRA